MATRRANSAMCWLASIALAMSHCTAASVGMHMAGDCGCKAAKQGQGQGVTPGRAAAGASGSPATGEASGVLSQQREAASDGVGGSGSHTAAGAALWCPEAPASAPRTRARVAGAPSAGAEAGALGATSSVASPRGLAQGLACTRLAGVLSSSSALRGLAQRLAGALCATGAKADVKGATQRNVLSAIMSVPSSSSMALRRRECSGHVPSLS
mmetsp:Transcript_106539/g.306363  ORF Transcript_106539/g.306363 Transcript_106539/m.306363 type:complete len:212 (+) Transcript_106539:380-1015(+)